MYFIRCQNKGGQFMTNSRNTPMTVGAVVAFALGIVAFHSITADTVGSAAQTGVSKPMSPLQMMRRDRDVAMQADDEAAAFRDR